MKKLFISLLVLISFSISAFAQEKSSREERGDKFFFIHAYDDAIGKYSRTKNLTASGQRNLAKSYCNMKRNVEAEASYAKLINSGKGLTAEDYYNYAMILKSSGKYNESDIQMNKFSEQKPNDLRAISYRENKGQFVVLAKDNGNFKIREMSINTPSQDFGTSFYKDKVVYASSNAAPKMIKRRDNRNNEPYFNLYVADVVDGQLKNRSFFDKKDNGKMHDGPASFNNLGTFMAYSKNVAKDKTEDNIVELRIFTRKFENEKWSEPVAFAHNNPASSFGHPHLSADGNTMYFVSDMPGGFGGTDLYRSTRAGDGSWSTPENLGNVINTEGDEMFPFFDESRKVLYFSSDGHYGLGGFDIFSSPMNGANWGRVSNAGAPLNTRNDDYALIFDNKSDKGYFSSNRSGGSGMDDIYGVDLLNLKSTEKKIAGIAQDAFLNPLPGTTVKLFDENGNEISEVTADVNGAYEFKVDTDKNYELTGNKVDYLEGKNTANTFGKEEIVTANLQLLQDGEEDVVVKDEDVKVDTDLGALIKLKTIYFAYDKSDISPTAAKELDKMVKVMNKFPNMEVEFKSHTDCRGTVEYNNALSQRRAQSTADYIKARITNPARIFGKGYGETALMNNCECGTDATVCTDAEHQNNRRSAFIVLKK